MKLFEQKFSSRKLFATNEHKFRLFTQHRFGEVYAAGWLAGWFGLDREDVGFMFAEKYFHRVKIHGMRTMTMKEQQQ